MSELPEEVLSKLRFIHEHRNVSLEKLIEVVKVSNERLKVSEQYSDPAERMKYALALTYRQYMAGAPTKEFTVIPVGYESVRLEKSGNPRSGIFVITTSGEQPKLQMIVCRGDKLSNLYKNVQLGYKYDKVHLGIYENSNDLFATVQTEFANPEDVGFLNGNTYEEFLSSVGIRRVRISEGLQNLSEKHSTGYVVRNDWRIVRGMIHRSTIFDRKKTKEDGTKVPDGTQGGVMNLIDTESTEITSDGRVNQLGCWSPPEQLIYDIGSIVDVAGTLEADDKGNLSMNAYWIIPVQIYPKEIFTMEEGE